MKSLLPTFILIVISLLSTRPGWAQKQQFQIKGRPSANRPFITFSSKDKLAQADSVRKTDSVQVEQLLFKIKNYDTSVQVLTTQQQRQRDSTYGEDVWALSKVRLLNSADKHPMRITESPTFSRIVQQDFAAVAAALTGQPTILSQVVVSTVEKSAEFNYVIARKRPKHRPLWRHGFRVKGGLDDDGFSSILSGNSFNSSIELGYRGFIDWYARTGSSKSGYTLTDTVALRWELRHRLAKTSIFRDSLVRAAELVARDNELLQYAGKLLQFRLDPARDPAQEQLFVDSVTLAAMRRDSAQARLKQISEDAEDQLFRVDSLTPVDTKVFKFLSPYFDLTNRNARFYDTTAATLNGRVRKRDFAGWKLGLAWSYHKIRASKKLFSSGLISGGYQLERSYGLFGGDPVEANQLINYGQVVNGTTTTNYQQNTTRQDVYVGSIDPTYVHAFTMTGVGFFDQKRDFGITSTVQRQIGTTATPSSRVDWSVGVIIPAVKDSKERTRLNLILTVKWEDLFNERENEGSKKLSDRRTIGIRLGVPLNLN